MACKPNRLDVGLVPSLAGQLIGLDVPVNNSTGQGTTRRLFPLKFPDSALDMYLIASAEMGEPLPQQQKCSELGVSLCFRMSVDSPRAVRSRQRVKELSWG
jgi:hypothetical protein